MNASRPTSPSLDHVQVWLFDLDNTLYPASCNLFAEVNQRMTDWIVRELKVPLEQAKAMRKRLYETHGTTLRGLMLEYDVDPVAYMDYVHDIDLTPVCHTPELDYALTRLPGRKLIFTNGSVRHAENVMGKLGIGHHFNEIFDIAAADFVPKPDPQPYAELVRRHGIDPRGTVFFEDIAKNLAPAHALGMTTVWVRSDETGGRMEESKPDGDYIHHVTDDLIGWLSSEVGRRANGGQ